MNTYAKSTQRQHASEILLKLRRVIDLDDACKRLGLTVSEWFTIEELLKDDAGHYMAKGHLIHKVLKWAGEA